MRLFQVELTTISLAFRNNKSTKNTFLNYKNEIWNMFEVIVDNVFACSVTNDIMRLIVNLVLYLNVDKGMIDLSEKNEGFSLKPRVDYDETYSPVKPVGIQMGFCWKRE